jgi:spore photoproduct lyase
MQRLSDKFRHIYLHRDSLGSSVAQRVYGLFPAEKISVVDERPLSGVHGELSPGEFSRSKELLYVCRYEGKFFKRCPGSRPGLACCNYFVLNLGLQCDMNCSYCYLQSFINSPLLTIYSNLEDALVELRELPSDVALRVGTGETIDSLSLDEITLYSRHLVEFFRDYPKWTLEFKTKSNRVDQFLDVAHAGNVLASWSVNPQHVISAEEHGTASLDERLSAAEKCLRADFRVAFHIDPMIWHSEWRENYTKLIDEITSRFQPGDIPYMSIGALRFQPEQRAMMRERFGMKSYVTNAETFPSRDGKWRYDARLRQEMFQFMLDEFRARHADWRIFMCMETPETWANAAGGSPFKNQKLHDLFDPRVVGAVER